MGEPSLPRGRTAWVAPAETPTQVLLCTDLHAGNVLAAEREPWLIIDPKPHVGDPTFDTLQHLLNCDERLRNDPVAWRGTWPTYSGSTRTAWSSGSSLAVPWNRSTRRGSVRSPDVSPLRDPQRRSVRGRGADDVADSGRVAIGGVEPTGPGGESAELAPQALELGDPIVEPAGVSFDQLANMVAG